MLDVGSEPEVDRIVVVEERRLIVLRREGWGGKERGTGQRLVSRRDELERIFDTHKLDEAKKKGNEGQRM